MAGILEGSDSFTGINWWIGQVAPRETWTENTLLKNDKDVGKASRKGKTNVYPNRVKVRVVGYHDQIEDPNDLPFASVMGNPFISSGYGVAPNLHQLEGGESVLGLWIDGDDEQKPVITNVFMKSQHPKDGQTTNLKSGVTPRSGILASTKDIKSTPEYDKTLDSTWNGSFSGEYMFSGEFIKNFDFKPLDIDYNFTPIPPKPERDDYPNTRSGAKKYDRDLEKWEDSYGHREHEMFDTSLLSGRSLLVKDLFVSDSQGGQSSAVKKMEKNLDKSYDGQTCKDNGAVGAISGILSDFSKLLIGAEKYGEFYVDAATGMVINFAGEIDQIARKIGGIMTAKVNNIRDYLFGEIEEKINSFTNKIVPEEIKPTFGEGLRGVMDNIFCLFSNVITGLNSMIKNFLKSLIGKFVNAPLCAAEQMIGALMSDILGSINDTIAPILSSLTATLGGALGSVTSLIGKALNGIGLLYNFIGCDDLKCPLPSRFDNKLGPQQGERDRVDKIMSGISSISDSVGIPGLGGASLFKKSEGDPSTVAALVGDCETNVLRCGPPTVEIFGGSGVGGVLNAVVAETTEIIGANILDRGLGYQEKPPYVTFRDACGDGAGARAKAIINPDDGGIDRILIEAPGYGYNSNFDRVITTSGILETDSFAEGDSMTGQIDDVIVTMPGFGYNSTDTIDAGNADLELVVLGGRVVGVKVNSRGSGFTNIPDLTINSQTGKGADLRAILKFVPVSEVSETLDPTQVISVVDCIEKPLTRNRIT